MALSMQLAVRPGQGFGMLLLLMVHRASMEPARRHQQGHSSSSLEAMFMPCFDTHAPHPGAQSQSAVFPQDTST